MGVDHNASGEGGKTESYLKEIRKKSFLQGGPGTGEKLVNNVCQEGVRLIKKLLGTGKTSLSQTEYRRYEAWEKLDTPRMGRNVSTFLPKLGGNLTSEREKELGEKSSVHNFATLKRVESLEGEKPETKKE